MKPPLDYAPPLDDDYTTSHPLYGPAIAAGVVLAIGAALYFAPGLLLAFLAGATAAWWFAGRPL